MDTFWNKPFYRILTEQKVREHTWPIDSIQVILSPTLPLLLQKNLLGFSIILALFLLRITLALGENAWSWESELRPPNWMLKENIHLSLRDAEKIMQFQSMFRDGRKDYGHHLLRKTKYKSWNCLMPPAYDTHDYLNLCSNIGERFSTSLNFLINGSMSKAKTIMQIFQLFIMQLPDVISQPKQIGISPRSLRNTLITQSSRNA